jgi:hypothetical protein
MQGMELAYVALGYTGPGCTLKGRDVFTFLQCFEISRILSAEQSS